MCENCGERQMIFQNAESFCEWTFTKKHCKYKLISHNGKHYDNYIILKYFLELKFQPKLIFSGQKIMFMYVKDLQISFIDSINFIQSSLSKMPKTFGEQELVKGYFPHVFNTMANRGYRGPIPDVSYFMPDQMAKSDRNVFLKWHSENVQEEYLFDLDYELEAYCISDVDILRRCLLKFRKLLLEVRDTDPL